MLLLKHLHPLLTYPSQIHLVQMCALVRVYCSDARQVNAH